MHLADDLVGTISTPVDIGSCCKFGSRVRVFVFSDYCDMEYSFGLNQQDVGYKDVVKHVAKLENNPNNHPDKTKLEVANGWMMIVFGCGFVSGGL